MRDNARARWRSARARWGTGLHLGTEWYRIVRNTASDSATIRVYDDIGWDGVGAKEFVADLAEITASTIDVRINSCGGSCFEGFAIFEALRNHRARINVHVDSLAASIASVIAMAGDTITVAPTATVMIHEASGVCIGDAAEMRKMGDLLDKLSDTIASTYSRRRGGTVAKWRGLMRAESWFNATEAVAAGLADKVAEDADEAFNRLRASLAGDSWQPPGWATSPGSVSDAEWAALTRRLTGGR